MPFVLIVLVLYKFNHYRNLENLPGELLIADDFLRSRNRVKMLLRGQSSPRLKAAGALLLRPQRRKVVRLDDTLEVAVLMAAIAEGLVLRMAAATKGNARPACEPVRFALGVKELKFSRD